MLKHPRRRLAAGLVFGFLVVLALAALADARQVATSLTRFDWRLAPPILLCTLFNYTLRFMKWHYYLGLIGVRTLSHKESARMFVGGFPLAVTPGKAGEALKAVWLNRVSGAPVAKGVTVVLAERLSDGLAVLALSTLGVIAYPQFWPAFAAILGILLATVALSQLRGLATHLLELASRLPVIGRFGRSLWEFYEGAFTLLRPIPTALAVGLGMVAWLGEGVAMYLVLLGLGISGGSETFGTAVFVLAFSTVLGAVSTLPGGLLAVEASISGMLILLLDLDTATAASAALLIRFGTLWFGVSLGLLVWTVSPRLLTLEPPANENPTTR